jgi:hypothetical protein
VSNGYGVWTPATGFSPTVYDVVHIASWALIVFGVIVVVFAIIAQIKRPQAAT